MYVAGAARVHVCINASTLIFVSRYVIQRTPLRLSPLPELTAVDAATIRDPIELHVNNVTRTVHYLIHDRVNLDTGLAVWAARRCAVKA